MWKLHTQVKSEKTKSCRIILRASNLPNPRFSTKHLTLPPQEINMASQIIAQWRSYFNLIAIKKYLLRFGASHRGVFARPWWPVVLSIFSCTCLAIHFDSRGGGRGVSSSTSLSLPPSSPCILLNPTHPKCSPRSRLHGVTSSSSESPLPVNMRARTQSLPQQALLA